MAKINVSVIIPTHNRASTIERCINSVLANGYEDLEIIVIDDGSSDETKKVVRGMNDNRIRYYYRKNGGVSLARNDGISRARGRYIVFLDSDDMLSKNFFADCFAEKLDADLLVCGIEDRGRSKHVLAQRKPLSCEVRFGENAYGDCLAKLLEMGLLNTCTGKVFLRNIIVDGKIFFDESLGYGEDLRFVLDYIGAIESVKTLSKIVYYVDRSNSDLSTRFVPDKFNLLISNMEYVDNFSRRYGITFLEADIYLRVLSCVKAGINNYFSTGCTLSKSEIKKEIRKIVTDKRVKDAVSCVNNKDFYCYLIKNEKIGCLYFVHKVWNKMKGRI